MAAAERPNDGHPSDTLASEERPHVRALTDDLGFPLDDFQRRATASIDADRSVLVAAPTGAGKTVVAEYAVADALDRGLRAFYTTPIKALSNQKFGELRDRYGAGRVGLLTGDNTVDGDASAVVMTTEVLRNMIYAGRSLDDLGVVVLDEVHYLQNTFRGPVWEEVIVHLPEHVKLVCLSATVSNAAEIGEWLSTVRGHTDVVVEHERPVELANTYLVGDKAGGGRLRLIETLVDGRSNPEGERFDAERERQSGRSGRGGARSKQRRRWFTPNRLEVVDLLAERDLLPAIVFIFSRAACDDAVRACVGANLSLTSASERRRIRTIVDRHLTSLSDTDFETLGGRRWMAGLEAGIAAHHAGHVPPFKEAVEACFVEGLVKVVFATETLALGINMPARAVVIERMTKFNGERREFLTPSEYTQLTGRAGRRGIDDHGTAIVLWSPFVTFAQIAGLAASRDFVLRSAFRPTYNMAVNLVRRHDPETAHRLLNQSLAQYQADRAVVVSERRVAERQQALDDAIAGATCDHGDVAAYRDLLQGQGSRRERRRRLASRLESLTPGDVIAVDDEPRVAVLSVANRSGERIRVKGVTADAAEVVLGMPDFRRPPSVLGSVTLPEPFQPADDAFRDAVAERLADTPLADRPAGHAADHPVGACPRADEHVRALDRADRLRHELRQLTRRIDDRTGSLGEQFDRVLGVLERWGYVDGWSVTERGELLAGVYHEAELVVAEAIVTGCFDGLDAPELAAVASVLVYEHRAPGAPPEPRYPSRTVFDRCHEIDRLANRIAVDEADLGLPESSSGDHAFAGLAHEWCAGEGLGELLEEGGIEITGGDFVRTIRQLIDLVRQIGQLAPAEATRATARRAVGALERGVVAATVELESDPT
ncbi:MAG: DEAD/DEAH box helicase [Acidimicrobiales bacterium]|nr:DEAD/DEAH box helicase [Acidimicrobiales bacterium]